MLLIFDIDNTLLYSDGRDSRAFATAFSDLFDCPVPSINWHEYPHVSDQVIVEHIFQQYLGRLPEPEEVARLIEEYVVRMARGRANAPDDYRTVPQAAETVARLRAEGYPVGIATGGFRKPQELKLRHVGISTEGLYAAYADGQPTREHIVRHAMEQAAHLAVEKTVYIGDALWDLRTTRNLGLPFVGIRRKGDHAVLLEAGAKVVLTDFSDWGRFLAACAEA